MEEEIPLVPLGKECLGPGLTLSPVLPKLGPVLNGKGLAQRVDTPTCSSNCLFYSP